MNSHRLGSFVLLAGGLVLVFAGVSSALGFSLWGMAATTAAIVALLYAGGVWFGTPPPAADGSVVLFTHALTVASGPHAGRAIADLYPASIRPSIEDGCRRALAGQPTRFTFEGSAPFATSPVRSAEGAVVYGLLLSGGAAAAEASAAKTLSLS